MTGLSAATLEYVLLGLAVVYTLISFFSNKIGTESRSGKILQWVMRGLPFVEHQLRLERDKAKAVAQASAAGTTTQTGA